ncbi:MAG: histone deacetylase [Deltaproteobacteria bacterium]|nr:histone deacetylase [Deltaproteobacteria bacterium]
MVKALLSRILRRAVVGRHVRIWHHPAYRLPLGTLDGARSVEPRRADLVRWYALQSGFATADNFRVPPACSWEELERVHTHRLIEDISSADGLARVFSVDPAEVPVDSLLAMVRHAVGGTVQAAYEALSTQRPMLNLLGGFHHAGKDRAGGFCPVNDMAVAVAALRAGGWTGKVAVIDLDAHPPDGTADCLAHDDGTWVGSLSGSDWGPLPRSDETVLPLRCPDRPYLAALRALLERMPRPDLAFVVAGGDVLAQDPLGQLGLTLRGTLERDALVLRFLRGRASVWLPGGGYTGDAWKVLAQTAELLTTHTVHAPVDADPMGARFAHVAGQMDTTRLQGGGESWISQEDVDAELGAPGAGARRLLGYYTAEGLEYGLFRYGILTHIHRLGYTALTIEVHNESEGDRLRVTGEWDGKRDTLMDIVLARRMVAGEQPVLFIHWLELRHPRAQFSDSRPRLPGQNVPGPGLAREAAEMLGQMARRLGLKGLCFKPAHFHVAYGARHRFVFTMPERQARFLALLRALRPLPLLEATRAVEEGRVVLDGNPYAWEPDDMVYWLDGSRPDDTRARALAERLVFTVAPVQGPPDSMGP